MMGIDKIKLKTKADKEKLWDGELEWANDEIVDEFEQRTKGMDTKEKFRPSLYNRLTGKATGILNIILTELYGKTKFRGPYGDNTMFVLQGVIIDKISDILKDRYITSIKKTPDEMLVADVRKAIGNDGNYSINYGGNRLIRDYDFAPVEMYAYDAIGQYAIVILKTARKRIAYKFYNPDWWHAKRLDLAEALKQIKIMMRQKPEIRYDEKLAEQIEADIVMERL